MLLPSRGGAQAPEHRQVSYVPLELVLSVLGRLQQHRQRPECGVGRLPAEPGRPEPGEAGAPRPPPADLEMAVGPGPEGRLRVVQMPQAEERKDSVAGKLL